MALLLAAVLIVASSVAETFLRARAWLAWLIVLDLVVIVLLRCAIHIGLLEEALEIPIGPEFRCANCGPPDVLRPLRRLSAGAPKPSVAILEAAAARALAPPPQKAT